MPRIELPSGGWVEYRDQLKASDRFAVQAVAKIEVVGGTARKGEAAGGDRRVAAILEMLNDQRNALLGRIITAWSFPAPVPAQNDFAAADVIIGDALDLDDYAALEEAVQPLMDKIAGRGQPDPKTRPTS
jgi:hypothetical protein